MLTAFVNASIFTGRETIKGKALLVENDRIKAFVEPGDVPKQANLVDCGGDWLSAGLIDCQVYGCGGHLLSQRPTSAAMQAITKALVQQGTTGFFITVATNSPEIVSRSIEAVQQSPHPALLGLHLEGPWINPVKRGAHLEQYIHSASTPEVTALIGQANGAVKMITLAPELNDPAIIHMLTAAGILVSAGHSNATFQEASDGFRNGIRATTHLFNAMSAFHHRDTGLPGATFQTPGIYTGIIADGIHVDFNTLSISKKLLGNRLFLITDAVVETLEGAYVHVDRGDRYTLPDGTLSGSRLTMMKAIQNCVAHADVPLEEAIRMATLYPANLIGRKDLGRIEVDSTANLVRFSTQFEVRQVWVGGELQ